MSAALVALLVAASVGSVVFGFRSYHSFMLLRSAYALGAPKVSTIRPWMTLGYIAAAYRVQGASLTDRLGLPPDTEPDTSLRAIAARESIAPVDYVQRVQRALVESVPATSGETEAANATWVGAMGQELLAALLVYGYPVLGLTLLLGAIGLPLPTGLSTVVAGSLAAEGTLSLAWLGAIALTASVVGDAVGYALGRLVSQEFLERRARWLGYTAARRARVESLFDRWGGLSVILSRTLVSHLSSAISVLAGAGRYRLDRFLLLALLGRLIWTSAYLSLGYAAGADLEAASGFLANISFLLVFLALLIGSGLVAARLRTTTT
jgi:membrane protein DedA with SNARE-associated domain